MKSPLVSRSFFRVRRLLGTILLCAVAAIQGEVAMVGSKAPTFSLPSLQGEREMLRTWCGDELAKPHVNSVPHVVVLSFWETVCKPCLKEMPELERFLTKHRDNQVKVFGINIDGKGAAVVAPFVKEKKITLPVLLDPYRRTAERYGVKAVPALFVIDTDGVVRYAAVGYKDGISIEQKLEAVLADIRSGRSAGAGSSEIIGDVVEVTTEASPDLPGKEMLTPRKKWKAVAAVECGRAPEEVAAELGVEREQLETWYDDLKGAVLELWGGKN